MGNYNIDDDEMEHSGDHAPYGVIFVRRLISVLVAVTCLTFVLGCFALSLRLLAWSIGGWFQ